MQDHELELLELKSKLQGSLLLYCQYMFRILEGKDFIFSNPIGRESHMITVCRELTNVFKMRKRRLIINLPPGHFKTTFLCFFVTWAFTFYPDCRFIFISYGFEVASKATYLIKRVMSLSEYKLLFDVHLSHESRAKDDFSTTKGGRVKAFGSDGPITGFDAGLPGLDRFSGGVFYDDPHKAKKTGSANPTEINTAIANYVDTVQSRPRSYNVPIVVSGQRVREEDLSDFLIAGKDGDNWERIILQGLDEARNALFPEVFPKIQLEQWEKFSPNMFAAQIQQNPMPAGGGLFRREWFVLMNDDPTEYLCTFITVDTAESAKEFADKTVFSFWGVYRIKEQGINTPQIGLHCIHGVQLALEPKDLEPEFRAFYDDTLKYKDPPKMAIIERKSTGTYLLSLLSDFRGLEIRGIERTRISGSKVDRYMEMQPYFAMKLMSFREDARHTKTYIDHMIKITDNDSHANDDICDTYYDAVKLVFIDKSLLTNLTKSDDKSKISEKINAQMNNRINLMKKTQLSGFRR